MSLFIYDTVLITIGVFILILAAVVAMIVFGDREDVPSGTDAGYKIPTLFGENAGFGHGNGSNLLVGEGAGYPEGNVLGDWGDIFTLVVADPPASENEGGGDE